MLASGQVLASMQVLARAPGPRPAVRPRAASQALVPMREVLQGGLQVLRWPVA